MTLAISSPQLQDFIRQSNNEDVKTRDASLRAVKDWLVQQPHLPDTYDDAIIMTFLRGCKFSVEMTKEKLDMYFTMRTAAPEIFSNRDLKRPELQKLIKLVNVPPLPCLTPEGYRVIVYTAKGHPGINLFDEEAIVVNTMVVDVRTIEEEVGTTGEVYIIDAYKFSPATLAKTNIGLAKKYMMCIQGAYPTRLKGVHFINAPPAVRILCNLLKPFIKDKLWNRIHIHSEGFERLYDFVPKDILPEEYGGTAGKLQDLHDKWMKKLEEYTPWFQKQENIKADESKRPGKSINYDEFFGVDGSFRQLSID